MIQLAGDLVIAYRGYPDARGVTSELQTDHLKWLRFFLDFCEKYKVTGNEAERWRQFNDKLDRG